MARRSTLELSFEGSARVVGFNLARWESEFQFAPGRRFRFDFAKPQIRLAIELEGITPIDGRRKSRHQTFMGYSEDCSKYNLAAELGGIVLRYTQHHLHVDPAGVFDQIRLVMDRRAAEAVELADGKHID